MLARDTSIYKDTQALLNEVIKVSRLFDRLMRQALGERSIDACAEMLTCIQMANIKLDEERLTWMNEFLVYEERLRTLMESGINSNTHVIGAKRIARYTELLTSVGRQMAGWRKATENAIASKVKVL